MESTIRALEESLRQAMLASDVPALEGLVSENLLFIGPNGEIFGKQDDINVHRSGKQKLTRADWEKVEIEAQDSVAISVVTAYLAGSFDGAEFSGRFRYFRTWARTGGSWQIIGGSVTAIAP